MPCYHGVHLRGWVNYAIDALSSFKFFIVVAKCKQNIHKMVFSSYTQGEDKGTWGVGEIKEHDADKGIHVWRGVGSSSKNDSCLSLRLAITEATLWNTFQTVHASHSGGCQIMSSKGLTPGTSSTSWAQFCSLL